ncbi:MAG: cell division protein SepF [Veillonellaceae bacterium]|nr:cell division protein SepF [Veillonellaceae bacterium]
MSLKDKLRNIFNDNYATDDEYDMDHYDDEESDDDYEESIQPTAPVSSFRQPKPASGYGAMSSRQSSMKVVVIEPKVFEDSENITNQLRDLRPVVINFEKTDPHETARIVDFVSGATYALDGKIQKIGENIFICVPMNITIDCNDKTTYSDLAGSTLAWKEPKAEQ